MKRTLVTLFALLVVASMALTACGPKATPAPTTAATTAPTTGATLTIWADDTRTPLLQALAADFEAATGVTLEITDLGRVQDIRTPVITAAPAGEGPDIFIGVHDWLGSLVDSGLVEPIDLGDKAAEYIPSTLDAFTYTDGNLYGVPYAYENLAFFYNTDYITTPPTTWDDVLAQALPLKTAGTIDYAFGLAGGLYENYPIWDSFGGYVFGKDANGAWDTSNVGLDSAGFVAALDWLGAAAVDGMVPTTIDYATALSLFTTGKSAFYLGGPWALQDVINSGVHYAITNFPDNGNPFSGVQGFMINAFSENKLLAQTFLTDYISTEAFQQEIYTTGLRPSAWASVVIDNPDLLAFGQAGLNAIPMPSIPEMGSVWTAANNMVTNVASGAQTGQEAATEAATQVRNLISGAMAGMVNLPGSFQDQAAVGCGAQWDPACTATAMELGADGLYHKTLTLLAGDWEYKVALDGSWTVSYGAADGSNFKVTVAADGTAVEFVYDPTTHLCTTTP